jgi:signal transduction histidine kinase
MGAVGPVNVAAEGGPAGGQPGSPLAASLARAAIAPFTRRAVRDLLFCLAAVPLGLVLFAVPLGLLFGLKPIHMLAEGTRYQVRGLVVIVSVLVLLLLLAMALVLVGRGLGAAYRKLAAELLGQHIAGPLRLRRPRNILGWPWAIVRNGPGWRAAGYLLLKLPVTVAEGYAVALGALGLAALSYPFWWALFRNHPADVHLQPVPVFTPFGAFDVATLPGTLAAFAAGAAMLLAAPWVARGSAAADCWLMRGVLGPGRLAQRVADLEQTRALAVEDSAATLRRLERDLHDGAQIRLATLALNLGMARDKLAADADPEVRGLIDAAHQGAKDALAELRNLARGIHPPALDNGLADALATLAASSATPAELTAWVPERPAPAIETMAYFCAAELLANAAKHSGASKISIDLACRGGALVLQVTDNGVGGADPARGTGLSGLAQRARTVDGRLEIVSPPGGPTQVTVMLPMRA